MLGPSPTRGAGGGQHWVQGGQQQCEVGQGKGNWANSQKRIRLRIPTLLSVKYLELLHVPPWLPLQSEYLECIEPVGFLPASEKLKKVFYPIAVFIFVVFDDHLTFMPFLSTKLLV